MVRISPDVPRWAAPARQGRARPRPCSRAAAQGSRLVREPWPDGRSRADSPWQPSDRELAVGFMAQGLRNVLNREDRLTLERWLGLFPDEFVQNRPELLVVRGFSLLLSWQVAPTGAGCSRMPPRCWSERASQLQPKLNRERCAGAWPCYPPSWRTSAATWTLRQPTAEKLWRSCLRHGRTRAVRAWLVQALAMQAGGQGQAAGGF